MVKASQKGAKDPLEGITAKTTKEELMNRLRTLATRVRKDDRAQVATLQAIEDRLRAKGTANDYDLRQVIGVATPDEWKEAVEFLEEFEDDNLLPVALARFLAGGRTLLGLMEEADEV